GEILVETRHDLHQGGFTRPVDTHDTDLDAGQKAEANIFEAFFSTGIGLRDAVHVVDVLMGCHLECSGQVGFAGVYRRRGRGAIGGCGLGNVKGT
ncbi:MAG: hypothetical protein ACI9AX_001642, partial [Polaromonas sp.]